MPSDYWKERMAKSQLNMFKKSRLAINRQLGKHYRNLASQVIYDYMATYDKLLNTIAEGNKPNVSDLMKLQKYWDMQSSLDESFRRFGNKHIKLLTSYFKQHYSGVYNSINIEGLKAFNTIDEKAISQVINQIWCSDGKGWSQRIWENVEYLKKTLNEGLIHCVVTGRSQQDLKKELRERFNVSYTQADSLVRTELSHIQTQAAKQRYRDYGIEQMEVLADEDERRCKICGKLHGKVVSINDPMPVPAHPRCRCTMIPVIK